MIAGLNGQMIAFLSRLLVPRPAVRIADNKYLSSEFQIIAWYRCYCLPFMPFFLFLYQRRSTPPSTPVKWTESALPRLLGCTSAATASRQQAAEFPALLPFCLQAVTLPVAGPEKARRAVVAAAAVIVDEIQAAVHPRCCVITEQTPS